jgi:hypothetical protein
MNDLAGAKVLIGELIQSNGFIRFVIVVHNTGVQTRKFLPSLLISMVAMDLGPTCTCERNVVE